MSLRNKPGTNLCLVQLTTTIRNRGILFRFWSIGRLLVPDTGLTDRFYFFVRFHNTTPIHSPTNAFLQIRVSGRCNIQTRNTPNGNIMSRRVLWVENRNLMNRIKGVMPVTRRHLTNLRSERRILYGVLRPIDNVRRHCHLQHRNRLFLTRLLARCSQNAIPQLPNAMGNTYTRLFHRSDARPLRLNNLTTTIRSLGCGRFTLFRAPASFYFSPRCDGVSAPKRSRNKG